MEELIWKNTFAKLAQMKPKPLKFSVGDYVKLMTKKGMFTKAHVQSWTTENFRIKRAMASVPTNYYFVVDLNNKPIVGSLVEAELIRVRPVMNPIITQSKQKKSATTKQKVTKKIDPVLRRSQRRKIANKKYV